MEPEWSAPDFSKESSEEWSLHSDGHVEVILGRIYMYQDNWFLGCPEWVLLNRNRCECKPIEDGFAICERKLPDWELLHPDDRNRTMYAGYSLKRPIRLVSAFEQDVVERRISSQEFDGEKQQVRIPDGRVVRIRLPTPLERLNPDHFTNRVQLASEVTTIIEQSQWAIEALRRNGH